MARDDDSSVVMFFVAGEMGGDRGRWLAWIGKSNFICDAIVDSVDG